MTHSANASSEPFRTLADAVTHDDASTARALIEQHPELRSRLDEAMPQGAFGATLLLTAVQRGNRAMVDLLLASGADINARSHWWAGSFGVLDGESSLVPYLIERGARVDAYAAARHGMLDRLAALVESDPAEVHRRGGDGQTPLHVARNVAVAEYLLDHGADIDALDVDHESTPAQYLIREHPDVARYLVGRGARTDILLAAALGDAALVARHLQEDPASLETTVSEESFPKRDPRAGGTIYIWTLGEHRTPHAVARQFGHPEVFRQLMERSPDRLRLSLACELGDEPLVRQLLAQQPDLASRLTLADHKKLSRAAQDNNTSAIRLMLLAGWRLDGLGSDGGTALHWAAFHGNADAVRMLLEQRPDLELRDPVHHGTALGWAAFGSLHSWYCRHGDYPGTVRALLQAGAQVPDRAGLDASPEVLEVLRTREGGTTGGPG
jgi:ankyrin repeat protein